MARIAFLGLGVMGAPMARHLAGAGHELIVYNRTAAKARNWVEAHGGRRAESPAAAADGAEAVIACVGADRDLEAVTLGPEELKDLPQSFGRKGAGRDLSAHDCRTIYEVPLVLEQQGVALGPAVVQGEALLVAVEVQIGRANLQAGWFTAYRALAKRTDLHAVLHLGDYLYEGGGGDEEAKVRSHVPAREIVTTADYRQRHAQYKADPDSQAVHAQHPFITVWDDHELANDIHQGIEFFAERQRRPGTRRLGHLPRCALLRF